jgi:hypothetical protein
VTDILTPTLTRSASSPGLQGGDVDGTTLNQMLFMSLKVVMIQLFSSRLDTGSVGCCSVSTLLGGQV